MSILYTMTWIDRRTQQKTELYGRATRNVVTDYALDYVDEGHDVVISQYVPERRGESNV